MDYIHKKVESLQMGETAKRPMDVLNQFSSFCLKWHFLANFVFLEPKVLWLVDFVVGRPNMEVGRPEDFVVGRPEDFVAGRQNMNVINK